MMKQQKIGEMSLEFCLHTVCVLILFYLLYVLYIFPLMSQHYLTFLPQGLFLYCFQSAAMPFY